MLRNRTRARSLRHARRLGYATNPYLPYIEPPSAPRTLRDATDRLLCLHAAVSCAYGFSKSEAWTWLRHEGLEHALAPTERAFLEREGDREHDNRLQWRVEAVWALAWAVGVHDELDFALPCADELVHMMPDLLQGAPTATFRAALALRSARELHRKLDLAYCLHWAVVDAHLHGHPIPGAIEPGVIIERRRALEWMYSDAEWDEVCLNT